MKNIKNLIKKSIKQGIENAVTRERIANVCGISKKEAKSIIDDMRKNDLEPICATSRDTKYFYPSDVNNAIEIRNKHKKSKNFKGCPHLEKYIQDETECPLVFKDYDNV